MNKIPYETFMIIMDFANDMNTPDGFVKTIRQFGGLTKSFKFITTDNRAFLQDFYYSMFPPVTIPTIAKHKTDDTEKCDIRCGRRKYYRFIQRMNTTSRFLDENGYFHESRRNYSVWPHSSNVVKTTYRCRNLDHYSGIKYRNKASRFKDLYRRCRDKYINDFLRTTSQTEKFLGRVYYRVEDARKLIKDYEEAKKLCKKRTFLKQLKNDYEKNKQDQKKRKTDK